MSTPFDAAAPEVMADPASAHARLRAECPVHRSDNDGQTMFTFAERADVMSVLTDTSTWSNRFGPGVSFSDDNVGDLQRYDPPEHAQRRRFVRAPFLPRSVASSEGDIEARAVELIEGFASHGRAELHDDYALPLPLTGFLSMMGIDDGGDADFKTWADELTLGMTFPDRAVAARKAMSTYTRGEVASRRRAMAAAGLEPGVDPIGTVVPEGLLSHLACHPLDDGTMMPEREVAAMVGQLLVAGHETTTSLITNAVWRLLSQRDLWQRFCADPSLAPNIVEESLRFDPPVLGLCKTNNVEVTAGGHTIEPDTKVMVLYASANRDGDTFESPDEFRIDRPLAEAKRHVSFGWGEHFCLGSHLARLTARVALEVLARRLPGLELDGAPERIEAPLLWGRRTMPVRW